MEEESILKKLVNHNNLFLCQRGNTAIRTAFKTVKENSKKNKILIPDQGGWITYKHDAEKKKFNVDEVKTIDGIFDFEDLSKKVKDAAAIIYENPAGYFANQNINEVYEVCKKNECLVILDVTGSIGDLELCNGEYADIMVCSFGNGKLINLGKGGFISFKNDEHVDLELMSHLNFPLEISDLRYALDKLFERRNFLYNKCNQIKDDLNEYNILYKNHRGIVVVVAFSNEKEKKKIIEYCESNKLEHTICPRYIRVLRDAVSIEVKRLF